MKASLLEVWKFRSLILELVRRDLKLRYKNSVGGIAWSLLNPLLQIAVITVLMRFILPNPVKNYSAYLFVFFLWNYFQVCVLDGCNSILANAALVRKVYFPRAILPLATLLANLFHFGVAFVFTILYFFVLRAYPANLRLQFLLVLPITFFMSLLCLGISLFLCYLNVFYEDVKFVVTALMQLFFYGLPILYPVESVAAHPALYRIYMLNPVAALVVSYQRALLRPPVVLSKTGIPLPPLDTPWGYLGIACVGSLLAMVVGLVCFDRNQWEMVERL